MQRKQQLPRQMHRIIHRLTIFNIVRLEDLLDLEAAGASFNMVRQINCLMKKFVLIIIFVSTYGFVSAQEQASKIEIPEQIATGFESYKSHGAAGAWLAWNQDIQFSDNKEQNKKAFVDTMATAELNFGAPTRVEFIKEVSISPSYCKIYYLLCFEKNHY